MKTRIVLDAAAFDVIDQPNTRLWALFQRSVGRDAEICCSAVTLAEVCRGSARTRTIEAFLNRTDARRRVVILATDVPMAKAVGAILYEARVGSEMIADAHVVAACSGADQAVVVTSDPDDISRLAGSLRGVRVVTRTP